jgi:chromosome segregation ATPase
MKPAFSRQNSTLKVPRSKNLFEDVPGAEGDGMEVLRSLEIEVKDDKIKELENIINRESKKSKELAALLREKEHVIEEMTADLNEVVVKSNEFKRDVDELRTKLAETQSELYQSKDTIIALNSTISHYNASMSPHVSSEYDLLDSIIGDLKIDTTLLTPVHRIESDHSESSTPKESKGSDVDEGTLELLADIKRDLDFEKKTSAKLQEQLDQCVTINLSREKELSSLVTAQDSYLRERLQLQEELHEVRQDCARLRDKYDGMTLTNKKVQHELSVSKEMYVALQMEVMKKDAAASSDKISRSISRSNTDTEEEPLVEFKDSFDYGSVAVADLTKSNTQSLLLVHCVLLNCNSCNLFTVP